MLVHLGSGSKKPRHFEERDYFLGEASVVCSWMLDGKQQAVATDTQEAVRSFVSSIQ